jgi:hypothetical protein
MSARYPYYLPADSPEGIKKEGEITGKIPPECKTRAGNLFRVFGEPDHEIKKEEV